MCRLEPHPREGWAVGGAGVAVPPGAQGHGPQWAPRVNAAGRGGALGHLRAELLLQVPYSWSRITNHTAQASFISI